MTKKVKKTPHIWDETKKLKVLRAPPMPTFYREERIDPGVNYFVLMLEQLGAVTHYSCEGHPNSFYVVFQSPAEIALRVLRCGFFAVELEGHNLWSLRINRPITESERISILKHAAETWEKELGPLKFKAPTDKTTKCKR